MAAYDEGRPKFKRDSIRESLVGQFLDLKFYPKYFENSRRITEKNLQLSGVDVKSNFIYHEDFAKYFLKLINKKGVINVGGKSQSIYNFAKKTNKDVKKRYSKGTFPLRMDMNLRKLNKILKK